MSTDLGRLIKTLGKKCPECLQPPMQLRARQVGSGFEKYYEYCPHCGFEKGVGYKEKGRRHGDKKRIRPEKDDGKTSR